MPQITINIEDNSTFNKIINDELINITNEEKHILALEAIKGYLQDPKIMNKIFFDSDYFGSNYHLNETAKQMIQSVNLDSECKEIANKIKDTIINNNKEVVTELLLKLFTDNITKQIIYTEEFSNAIMCQIRSFMNNN